MAHARRPSNLPPPPVAPPQPAPEPKLLQPAELLCFPSSPYTTTLTPLTSGSSAPTSQAAALLPALPLPTLTTTLSAGEQAVRLASIAAYGLPSVENVVVRNGYIASANFRTKGPNWVLEDYSGRQFAEKRSNGPWGRKQVEERDSSWQDAADNDVYGKQTIF